MRFEDFQDGHLGSHLSYRTRTISTIRNLFVTPMHPIKFGLNSRFGLGDVFWRSSGGHLGYRNGTIFAVLNLYVSRMPPNRFQLNPTYVPEQMSFQDFQAGLSRWPSWILDRNQFSNSMGRLGYWNGTILAALNLYVAPMPSPPPPLQPIPISFSSNQLTVLEKMSFEYFQHGWTGGHLGYRNRMILAILNLHRAPMSPTNVT